MPLVCYHVALEGRPQGAVQLGDEALLQGLPQQLSSSWVVEPWYQISSLTLSNTLPLLLPILSSSRTPFMRWLHSIVSPIMPSTRLFHHSSRVPPPEVGFTRIWKCPPFAFAGSSHSGLMAFRKIMKPSTPATPLPVGVSLMNRFESNSSLGCGTPFQTL